MPDTPTLTAERLEDGKLAVSLRSGSHCLVTGFTHAQLSEAVAALQAVLSNAAAADAEDAQFAGES